MAISATHYALLRELHSQGVLPQGGRILEIGQANWYGDFDFDVLKNDWMESQRSLRPAPRVIDCAKMPGFPAKIVNGVWEKAPVDCFGVVNAIYQIVFATIDVISIDLDPAAPDALRADLCDPIDLGEQFDVVYNHGTMEHPSQDLETQETMHRHCKVGGLLIHEAPYNQPEHGQRSYSLNFFTGMAKANEYEMVCSALEHMESRTYWHVKSPAEIQELHRRRQLQHDLMLFVCMRKTTDAPYVSRWMQDVYSGECEAGRVLLVR